MITLRRRTVLPDPALLSQPLPHEPTRWVNERACASHPEPDIFFEPEGIDEAIQVCGACPALEECRDWAMAIESHGVWGGLSADQRDAARGGPPRYTLEDRRFAHEIAARLARGDHYADIARDCAVHERTLYRWAALTRDDWDLDQSTVSRSA